ncbi:MAG: OstA family protein [Microcoleus vaginatus WJT46-NPBG5]|jgi:lipopolysaccharide export system protein LptA|nr:OstA family protein [Microcoleus vaginatus WJT46-NPBG5]
MMSFAKLPGLLMLRLGLTLMLPVVALFGSVAPTYPQTNPAAVDRPLTLRSDIQEADAKTGVVTARGNVQIDYPARQIQATAAQAQYFSKERRIVLSGDVYVLQEGNSLRGENIVYLIDEGRFIALPKSNRQVESIYLVPEENAAAPGTQTAPATPEF